MGDTLAVPKHPSHPVGGRSMVRKLLGPVVLALVFPVILAAQSQATTGVIRGTVTDPSGTVVVEATQPVVDATKIETSTRLPEAAVSRLPNNGRNYLNLTLLTPNVAIVQGPDGDELSIGGQKGIHNNVSV